MKKKKMGRPTDAPKTNNMRIRMSDEDLQILETCSRITGMSKADVIRQGIRMIHAKLNK